MSLLRWLDEPHHRWYGRPWIMGRYQFEFLVSRGVRTGDTVVDYGCGAGRLGVHLVRYLDAHGYVGIDPSADSLEAFGYELVLHGLCDKEPTLSTHWHAMAGRKADVVVDHFASVHLGEEDRVEYDLAVLSMLRDGGRLFRSPSRGPMDGMKMIDTYTQRIAALIGSEHKETNEWEVWQK